MIQLHAIFHGKVQGVGFRWTVVDHAEKLHLSGTVKNLPNGTVEVYAQGEKSDLDTFLKAIKKDPGNAAISSVKTSYEVPKQAFSGFRIDR